VLKVVVPDRAPTSRRQLTPVFDKPAFSRFSLIFQPRFVVHSFWKIVKRQVCQKRGELPTAGTDMFRWIGRCAIFGFVSLGQKKSQDAYRTSHSIPFGWSMCDIRCLYFSARKITRCISHISPVSVRFSRRQLTPVFDKPAFSRFSQNCEPLIVVEIFGKIVKR